MALLLLGGCTPPPAKQKRYFWPMLSHDPKIEFIDFYISDYDVLGGRESAFVEAVAGRRKPRAIFSVPYNVASDGDENITYVIDQGKHKVWVLDLGKREIRTLFDEKKQTQLFRTPVGVAVGPDGGVFVSDAADAKIYYFDRNGVKRREFASKTFSRPTGLAYDEVRDRLYVSDTGRHQLLIFDGQGNPLKTLGERGRNLGQFNFPTDVALSPGGEIVVLDSLNARVQVFGPDGSVLRAFGERGTALGAFALPKGVAVDSYGHVYVTDTVEHKLVVFSLQGEYLLTIGGKHVISASGGVSPGGFYLPQGIDVDSKGGIWICDTFNRAVYQFQYLDENFLREHPIEPGDIFRASQ